MSASTDGRMLVWEKKTHEKDKISTIVKKTDFKLLEHNITLKRDGKPRISDVNSSELLNASCFEVYSDNGLKYILGTEQGLVLPLKKARPVANQYPPLGKEFNSNVILGKDTDSHHGPI